jgi:hypothetical protein
LMSTSKLWVEISPLLVSLGGKRRLSDGCKGRNKNVTVTVDIKMG